MVQEIRRRLREKREKGREKYARGRLEESCEE
jgi:hypothetical protein